MTELWSKPLRFLVICAGVILLILIATYALDHPAVRTPLLALTVGGAAFLWIFCLTQRRPDRTAWCTRIGALVGVLILAAIIALTGGSTSGFWPAFLWVTISTAATLARQESVVFYVLAAIALTAVNVYPLHTWTPYDVALLLAKLGATLIPAELYRQLCKVKEQHQTELMHCSRREQQAMRDLSRRNVELNLLNNVALTLNSTLDLDHILTRVIELSNTSLGIEVGSVSLLDEESGELVLRTLVGRDAKSVDGLHIPKGQGISGWVCEHGETALVHDVQNDPRFYNKVDELSGFATRSILCIPLRSKERIIGVIEAINKAHGRFTQEDQQLMEGLATISAPAIENALLHTQLRRVNHALVQRYNELRQTQDQLVAAEKKAATLELAGAAAHQLNQPLTVVLCSLGMIRSMFPPDHAVLEDLDVIEQAVEQAAEIVKKIGSITEYKTKTYVEGIQILDLETPSDDQAETPPSEQ
jgi:putative methionine-R-sulfoxide reductase with GAF domain